MRDWIRKLFCRHKWNHHCYNIKSYEYGDNYDIITIGFQYCKKCASSKLNFIFGNK